jgi:predicted nuclease of restriction endonuclease-like (RecB) superfamily
MSTKLVKKDSEFAEVLGIIRAGRAKAYKAVNVALIETYWAVGAHLSSRVAEGGWGKGVVRELSDWLLRQAPDLKGFSASNLWRMKQFYDVYADQPKLAALLRVLPWTHNLIILGHSKRPEEREFYLRLAVRAKWSSRELARQIRNAAFERTVLSDKTLEVANPAIKKVGAWIKDVAAVFALEADLIDLTDAYSAKENPIYTAFGGATASVFGMSCAGHARVIVRRGNRYGRRREATARGICALQRA